MLRTVHKREGRPSRQVSLQAPKMIIVRLLPTAAPMLVGLKGLFRCPFGCPFGCLFGCLFLPHRCGRSSLSPES